MMKNLSANDRDTTSVTASKTPSKRLTDLSTKNYLQTDHFFCDAGMWYFRTREGIDVGPFRYRCEAEAMFGRFMQEVQEKQQVMASVKPHFRTAAVIGTVVIGNTVGGKSQPG
jgi:hypothetical protein